MCRREAAHGGGDEMGCGYGCLNSFSCSLLAVVVAGVAWSVVGGRRKGEKSQIIVKK